MTQTVRAPIQAAQRPPKRHLAVLAGLKSEVIAELKDVRQRMADMNEQCQDWGSAEIDRYCQLRHREQLLEEELQRYPG